VTGGDFHQHHLPVRPLRSCEPPGHRPTPSFISEQVWSPVAGRRVRPRALLLRFQRAAGSTTLPQSLALRGHVQVPWWESFDFTDTLISNHFSSVCCFQLMSILISFLDDVSLYMIYQFIFLFLNQPAEVAYLHACPCNSTMASLKL